MVVFFFYLIMQIILFAVHVVLSLIGISLLHHLGVMSSTVTFAFLLLLAVMAYLYYAVLSDVFEELPNLNQMFPFGEAGARGFFNAFMAGISFSLLAMGFGIGQKAALIVLLVGIHLVTNFLDRSYIHKKGYVLYGASPLTERKIERFDVLYCAVFTGSFIMYTVVLAAVLSQGKGS